LETIQFVAEVAKKSLDRELEILSIDAQGMNRTISVVIPTYNYKRFIGDALQSVLGQTLPPSEILVVDDGSEDDTESVVRSFGERVRYIRQKNAGVSSARNRGVAETSGELITFVDADDVVEPEFLEALYAEFTGRADVGLAHCGTRLFDSETGETLSFDLDGGAEGVADNLLLWEGPGFPAPGLVMVRREAFADVGGFDSRQKVGEDWDFCYRVARQYKVGFVPKPLINYRIHRSAAHHNLENMEIGMSLFYERAFDTRDPKVLAMKKRAMGNFHKVMAGSYFQAGRLGEFARHSVKSIWNRPANLGHFLSYPLRRFKNRGGI
jgi:glycosyltransferase involved in cell wall biosynthesis